MNKEKFPEAIKRTGVEKECLFWLKKMVAKGKETYELLIAKNNGVEEVNKEEVYKYKGKELPIYVQLIETYIFMGETRIVA